MRMPENDESDTEPEGIATIERYFRHLEAAEFEEAARQFSEDTTYVHPPTYQDEMTVHGRESLLEYFRDVRGSKDVFHEIDRAVVDADGCAIVGRVTGPDVEDAEFVSFAEFEDGLITYYISGTVR